MTKIIAIANQKGGVGKTTTSVNLASSLAVAERRTLLVDCDPQGNATSGLGVNRGQIDKDLYQLLINETEPSETVCTTALRYLHLLPATRELIGAEIELQVLEAREKVLGDSLSSMVSKYDYVILDCPPSLGILTLNALTAAKSVLIPIQCEYYALEGVGQLLNSIRLVQKNLNPNLVIEGILLTMYDRRLNLSNQVADEVRSYFEDKVYNTIIARNVTLGEAPSFGKPIILYDIQSVGAKAYLELARLNHKDSLYCQGCGTCLKQCSSAPDIPTLMRCYMYTYGYRDLPAAVRNIKAVKENPIACADCASCVVKCPMGFDIKERALNIIRLRDFPPEFLA